MAEKVKDHTRMLGVVMMVTGFSASYKEYTLNKDKLAIANFFPRLIYFPCWPFLNPPTTPPPPPLTTTTVFCKIYTPEKFSTYSSSTNNSQSNLGCSASISLHNLR